MCTSALHYDDRVLLGLLIDDDSSGGRSLFWVFVDMGQTNTFLYVKPFCIGTAPLQKCVMPDGSRPRSATDYEVAWALDQSKRTPGFPGLLVNRNQAIPVALLEPEAKRVN